MSEPNEILKPGDWLLIAVQMPEEWVGDYHQDIFFEDYTYNPPAYKTQVHGIVRKEEM